MYYGPVSAPDWSERPWPAAWITASCAPATDFAVVHFRRTFDLTSLPDSLPVLVSADNRYQLYVNGQRVGMGPARSDRLHWRYETYELLPYLQAGPNTITATVWNYGIDRPWSQESYRTAFLLQPRGEDFSELRTDAGWSARCDAAYSPHHRFPPAARHLHRDRPPTAHRRQQVGRGAGATQVEEAAVPLLRANPRGIGTEMYWPLVPRQIPLLELRPLPHRR